MKLAGPYPGLSPGPTMLFFRGMSCDFICYLFITFRLHYHMYYILTLNSYCKDATNMYSGLYHLVSCLLGSMLMLNT